MKGEKDEKKRMTAAEKSSRRAHGEEKDRRSRETHLARRHRQDPKLPLRRQARDDTPVFSDPFRTLVSCQNLIPTSSFSHAPLFYILLDVAIAVVLLPVLAVNRSASMSAFWEAGILGIWRLDEKGK